MRLRTLPFPVRRPTFAEVKRVHTKLATLYHPLTAREKPKLRADKAHPTLTETVTNSNPLADNSSTPNDDKTVTENIIDYPDTRIKLQLDSPHKQPDDGIHVSTHIIMCVH